LPIVDFNKVTENNYKNLYNLKANHVIIDLVISNADIPIKHFNVVTQHFIKSLHNEIKSELKYKYIK